MSAPSWPVWTGAAVSLAALAGVLWFVSLWTPQHAPEPATAAPAAAPEPAPEPKRPQPVRAPPPAAEPRGPSPTPEAAPPSAPPPEDAAFIALRNQVQADVSHEIDRTHASITARCFPNGAGPEVRVTYQIVIGDDGKELARGVSEERGPVEAIPFSQCVRQAELPPVQIRPPGRQVTVDVPVRYP